MSEGQSPLDGLLDRVPSLAGHPRTAEELPGGLTNRNYKVTTPDGVFVARVWSAGSELLAIDRGSEYRNSVIAADAGVGAPVIEYRPDDGVLVIGYIQGRTLTNAGVALPANIARIARSCRRLHSGGRFGNDFDMFDIQRRYASVVRDRGLRVPRGYHDLMPQFDTEAFPVTAQQLAAGRAHVPCNNDLLVQFIDDGERIWLIDYEYSGNNDPCFELGNVAAECHLSPTRWPSWSPATTVPLRNKIARARLLGLAGKYGWTLWGAIQSAASPLDFDFWSWAMERFDGAAEGLTDAGFPPCSTRRPGMTDSLPRPGPRPAGPGPGRGRRRRRDRRQRRLPSGTWVDRPAPAGAGTLSCGTTRHAAIWSGSCGPPRAAPGWCSTPPSSTRGWRRRPASRPGSAGAAA
jgi:thiamine kinase-like enzyme